MIDCVIVDAADESETVVSFETPSIPQPGDILEVKLADGNGPRVATKWEVQPNPATWRIYQSGPVGSFPPRLRSVFVVAKRMQ